MNLELAAVKAVVGKGSNPNAASLDPNPLTPLLPLTCGRGPDAPSKALEIAKVLFSSGVKIGTDSTCEAVLE